MNEQSANPLSDCQDILCELKDWQFLLRCLYDLLGDAYSLSEDDESREVIQGLSTMLRAYNVDRVVESLENATKLIEDAKRMTDKSQGMSGTMYR